jgi:hypothetical protein
MGSEVHIIHSLVAANGHGLLAPLVSASELNTLAAFLFALDLP